MKHFAFLILALMPAAAAACLDPDGPAAPIAAQGIALHEPMRVLVEAGGAARLPCAETGAPVEAHVSLGPAAEFDLSGMGPHILAVRGYSDCPVRLVVFSAAGSWVVGRDPREAVAAGYGQELYLWSPGDGRLRVWLGTTTPERCPGEIELETYDH